MAEPFLSRVFNSAVQAVNRIVPWHRWPRYFGVIFLFGFRDRLRRLNLQDTGILPSKNGLEAGKCEAAYLVSRSPNGTYNDLSDPTMGAAGTRFGRNVPLDNVYPEQAALLLPNPRTISLELMTRDEFQPARSLNLLAGAWIQFMVHDWFSHGENDKAAPYQVPLSDSDPWPDKPMEIPRTMVDRSRPADSSGPPAYINTATHWWDGSQLYGTDRDTEMRLRSGEQGKMRIAPDGLLPLDSRGIDDTGVNGNWWVGLSMLHTLFVREHNAICDRLLSVYSSWSDEELFTHARLVNVAVMAKIHTVEWTPAILGHPALKLGMHGNWWGVAGERITSIFGRLSKGDILSGIPGSPTEHHSAPYSMTEEFVSVYRMHSLMPDTFSFRSALSDETVAPDKTLPQVSGRSARPVMNEVSLTDLVYSFGTSHPGALVLHNYPRFLQRLEKEDGSRFDMAAVDILRDRERGVPRYNRFRELIHLPRITSFDKLTDNPKLADDLRRVYSNDIDSVDLMVGMMAESPRPAGFGFSETAFRIFLLMAPRRLKSDRFFTVDYTPEVYTQTGLDWINHCDMSSVLLRHFPGVTPALARVENAFFPWRRMHHS